MKRIECSATSMHEVPISCDESGSINMGPVSHLFSDGHCM